MSNSSQFLDIVNKSHESDDDLDCDERLDKNVIRAEAFGNDESAGHDTEIARYSSDNTYSSGDDYEESRYGTNDTF